MQSNKEIRGILKLVQMILQLLQRAELNINGGEWRLSRANCLKRRELEQQYFPVCLVMLLFNTSLLQKYLDLLGAFLFSPSSFCFPKTNVFSFSSDLLFYRAH